MRAEHFAKMMVLAVALIAADSRSGSAQSDFSGKTIRLYIGTGPGGGYDTYGRLVARHIGRHIAGNPVVLAQNMPGASSLTLTNFLFNTAPRDGTAIGIINQAMPTEQYLDIGNANYDAKRFSWIGRVSSAVEMAIVWHTVPVHSIDDVRRRETLMGGTGPTSSTVFVPYLLDNLAGMKFKVITGFNGTTEIALAMERGEVEGSATPLESLTSYRADWVRDRKIRIFGAVHGDEGRRDARRSDHGRARWQPGGPPNPGLLRQRGGGRPFDRGAARRCRRRRSRTCGGDSTRCWRIRSFSMKPSVPAFNSSRCPESGCKTLVARVGSFPPSLIEKARQARERPS